MIASCYCGVMVVLFVFVLFCVCCCALLDRVSDCCCMFVLVVLVCFDPLRLSICDVRCCFAACFVTLFLRIAFVLCVVRDQHSQQIAAASIFAKHFRDTLMSALSLKYPHYHLEKNKGFRGGVGTAGGGDKRAAGHLSSLVGGRC